MKKILILALFVLLFSFTSAFAEEIEPLEQNQEQNVHHNIYFIESSFMFLIVAILLGFFAFYIQNYALLLGSSLLLFILPFAYDFQIDIMGGSFQYIFFILIAIALMYQSFSLFLTERKR
jgi:hypothetical protein